MDLENLFATTDIRQTDHNLTVETARTKQCRVQYVGTVGRGNHDDAVIHFETVHLHQQLVESLLALVMTAAHTGTTVTTDGVDFVDKDDAWSVFLGLFEHIANTAGTDTDEHFDEIGTGNGEERHFGFASNRLGQQGFTGTRRTHHQHAAWNATAQTLELARIPQKLD
ncbi:hypothetical protein D3C73_1082580 [compost metagenome]